MAFWGKMFGGVAGFAAGGPVGGLLGMILGHLTDTDKILTPPSGTWGDRFPTQGRPDPHNAAFFTAAKLAALFGKTDQLYGLGVVTLSAKLAKIDGPVNRAEINAFKAAFRFPAENQKEVGLLFDRARERTDDFELYAQELGRAFADKPEPLESLLTVLFRIAKADLPVGAELHPLEQDFLRRTHRAFRLSARVWERAETGQARAASTSSAADCYRILGISAQASDSEVRTRWRVLIREYHPDRLAQQPMTDAQRKAAQERIARINAAWDQIKRDRGL
ncbi:TerB family tellurite resistance protein [Bombella pollinis]|uniref:TerB family tellurite resistance protein n=1 Tax=Bombella pollinis TaxID=2967337 RepID=A0ABT3WN84_9PROT|nr:TerB family tellurite resistance protein [Bombella pollinis]MCX5620118.1 TerB family tellurite resistance protein [Bombella pollinis]